jgi:COP9 signalosome complex subunit 6
MMIYSYINLFYYQVIVHLTTQRNAIAMLNSRIQFLLKYLQDTQSGVIPVDQDIIRQISSLCRRSPVLEKKAFDEQFSTVSRWIDKHA